MHRMNSEKGQILLELDVNGKAPLILMAAGLAPQQDRLWPKMQVTPALPHTVYPFHAHY